MSAPKTKAGRARALAKCRDLDRPRKLGELKEMANRLGKLFHRYAKQHDNRGDAHAIGRIIELAGWAITHKRQSGVVFDEIGEVLCDAWGWPNTRRYDHSGFTMIAKLDVTGHIALTDTFQERYRQVIADRAARRQAAKLPLGIVETAPENVVSIDDAKRKKEQEKPN